MHWISPRWKWQQAYPQPLKSAEEELADLWQRLGVAVKIPVDKPVS
jgi:hypothetical protein